MLLGKPLTLDQWLRLRSIEPMPISAKSVMKTSERSISTAPPRIGLSATIGSAMSTESVKFCLTAFSIGEPAGAL